MVTRPTGDRREPAAGAALRHLIMGFRSTQLIHVAAKLGLADRLKAGPQTAQALAEAVGAEPRALYRVLRALASLGIFAESSGGGFTLTPLAELLRSDVDGSLRSLAALYGEEWLWDAYGRTLHSVLTGAPAFERTHGTAFFEYLDHHATAAALFHDAMTGYSAQEAEAILAGYDFSRVTNVVDVGGGHGALLARLLRAHRGLSGVVLDLPASAPGARRLLAEAGVAGRGAFAAGDFFDAIPRGGDVYLLKSVIHNWDDEAAVRILRRCREAMAEDARLLVIERVIPAGNEAAEAKLFDINMLVVIGGRERTEEEYRALFHSARFRLTQTSATSSPVGLLVGTPE